MEVERVYGFQKHILSMSKPLTDMIDNFIVYQESVAHYVVGQVLQNKPHLLPASQVSLLPLSPCSLAL